MAIANLQEKMLFFNQRKSQLTLALSDVQTKQLAAAKKLTQEQMQYNNQLKDLYYDPVCGYGSEEYTDLLCELQNDHEFELSELNSWESQLEMEKTDLENELNIISGYESTFQKLLSSNIKADFSYGGSGGKS